MRIAVIAPGSRGDVQPYLALAKGLMQHGHDVRLVTHQNYEELVGSHGVELIPIKGDVQEIAQGADMRLLLEKGNFLAILSEMGKKAKQGARLMARAGLIACQDADLVIAGVGGIFIGVAVAEKLGLPLVQAYYIPFTPTSAYPSFIVPTQFPSLGGLLNRMSYVLAQQVMWQAFRSADMVVRTEVLDIPASPFRNPFKSACLQHTPILYGYSHHVIPRPADWDANTYVTGYWFLDYFNQWAPPQSLIDFLNNGPPPVYIGFGSMSNRNPEGTAHTIFQVLDSVKQRGIILSGWGGLQTNDAPDHVYLVESVPFAWLFPKVAAVIHHGGAGTTAEVLRAGVPSITIPFFGDQPYWGSRVASLGVGSTPIPFKHLTEERLVHTIKTVITDKKIRQQAGDIGVQIQAENGVACAVEIIQSFIGKSK